MIEEKESMEWTEWDTARELRALGYGSGGGIPSVVDDPAVARSYEALVLEREAPARPRRWRSVCGRAAAVLAFFAAWVGVLGAASSRARLRVVAALADAPGGVSIEASNARTVHAGFAPGRGYPWIPEGSLVEPGVATTFAVAGADPTAAPPAWTVEGTRDATTAPVVLADGVAGAAVDVAIPFAGDVRVSAAWPGGATVTRAFTSRYVRRSLRALRDADRDAFFDAVGAGEGK